MKPVFAFTEPGVTLPDYINVQEDEAGGIVMVRRTGGDTETVRMTTLEFVGHLGVIFGQSATDALLASRLCLRAHIHPMQREADGQTSGAT